MSKENFGLILILLVIAIIYLIKYIFNYYELKRKQELKIQKIKWDNYERRIVNNIKFDLLFILITTKIARGDFDTKRTSVKQKDSKAKTDKK